MIHDIHACTPKHGSVEHDPCLFCKSYSSLLFLYTTHRSQRVQNVVHDNASQSGENNDPVENEEDVVPAQGKLSSGRVEVGDVEELLGMVSGLWEEDVGSDKEAEGVQRDT